MGTVASIAPATRGGVGDPLRAALKSAVEGLGEAEAAVSSHRVAISRGRQFIEDADAAVTVAERAVEAARAEHGEALAAAAGDGRPAPTSGGVRAARQALLDAQDEAAAARSAVAELEGSRLIELQEARKHAENRVLTARNQVIASVAAPMIKSARTARRAFLLAREILPDLVREDRPLRFDNTVHELRAGEVRRAPLLGLEREIHELLLDNWSAGSELVRAWQAWKNSLLTDPDLPAPTL